MTDADQRTQLETELKDTQIANAQQTAPAPGPTYYMISHEELQKLALARQHAVGLLMLHTKKHPLSRNIAVDGLAHLVAAMGDAQFEEAKVTKKRVKNEDVAGVVAGATSRLQNAEVTDKTETAGFDPLPRLEPLIPDELKTTEEKNEFAAAVIGQLISDTSAHEPAFPDLPRVSADPDFKYDPSEVVYGTDVADGKQTVIGVVMRDGVAHIVSEETTNV